jgi:hypothetical protein
MDIHRSLVDDDLFAPDGVEQILSREDPSRLQRQSGQQAVLLRPEQDLVFADDHPPPLELDPQRAAE